MIAFSKNYQNVLNSYNKLLILTVYYLYYLKNFFYIENYYFFLKEIASPSQAILLKKKNIHYLVKLSITINMFYSPIFIIIFSAYLFSTFISLHCIYLKKNNILTYKLYFIHKLCLIVKQSGFF